jgi:hypothetical protein
MMRPGFVALSGADYEGCANSPACGGHGLSRQSGWHFVLFGPASGAQGGMKALWWVEKRTHRGEQER